jgi:sirohydrochlorin ferrochelatase
MNANGADTTSDTKQATGDTAGQVPAAGDGAAGDGAAGNGGDDLAVAGRMAALAGRGHPGDFAAVYMLLRTGRHTRDRLTELLHARDAGYDPFSFAGVLAELPHIPDEEFAAAGLDELEIAIMRACFADWYRALVSSGIP